MDPIDPNTIALADEFFDFTKVVTTFAFILAVVWVSRHYKWRRHRGAELSDEDRAALEDLGRVAERLDARVATLERILDADDPKWRDRAA
ncbi:MAG: envelope stress response membrane protein PspB [Rhodospirillaceae bacterium]|nr:envelope stress response membrane protein PspB [Rhodospirillaceae bacterium]